MSINVERIVVADHHPLCRAGLAALLSNCFAVGEIVPASDLPHTLAAIARAPVTSMVTVNMELPGMNGVAGLRRLRAEHPELLVVVVAESRARELVLETLGAGVHGYIVKATPAEEMSRAFETVLAGEIYVPPLVSDLTIQATPMFPALAEAMALTERQQEVLELVAAGRSNKEIARSLLIAEGTVKVHVTAGFRALGVHNRVSAAAALRGHPRGGYESDQASPVAVQPFAQSAWNSAGPSGARA